jgi:hypothetical protein
VLVELPEEDVTALRELKVERVNVAHHISICCGERTANGELVEVSKRQALARIRTLMLKR